MSAVGEDDGSTPGASAHPEPLRLDVIEIRGLRVLGVHGVLADERHRAQPFSVDLDIWIDAQRAAETDALEDTADYGALIATAARVVGDASFQLLEALADCVARELLESDHRITQVSVTVRKLRPPVPLDVDSAGVRVVRKRA